MENKISKLRELMKKNFIDTYIITKFDPHQSEYADEYFNSVKFISGFTGSNAIVVITMEKECLWTDGRYTLQASEQLKNTNFEIFNISNSETEDFKEFIFNNTKNTGTVGFDGKTVSFNEINKLKTLIQKKNIKLKSDIDLINEIWENRPPISSGKFIKHDTNFCGETLLDKLKRVRIKMKNYRANMYIISSLDDIAWLLNIRSIKKNSSFSFYCYTIITNTDCIIFIDENNDNKDILNELKNQNIIIKPYSSIEDYLNNLNLDTNHTILIDSNKTNYTLYNLISKSQLIFLPYDITSSLKSIKNTTEIKNIKIANIKYAIALIKTIKYIKESINDFKMTELDIEEILINNAKKDKNYLCQSFNTISAYNENGAIIHYDVHQNIPKTLKPEGLLLLDSGANYLEGTTDITRTISLGNVTQEMKDCYTLVLKSHIALSQVKFLKSTTGSNLDAIARYNLWQYGLDYKHGTSHGIGFCLNVHEGPQRIAFKANDTELEVGMLLSNEPGVYLKDKFGIRLENSILVKDYMKTESGTFLQFETVSYIPFDRDMLNLNLLDKKEIEWLNNYHKITFELLSPYLSSEEKDWLYIQTKQL